MIIPRSIIASAAVGWRIACPVRRRLEHDRTGARSGVALAGPVLRAPRDPLAVAGR
jgi:hypothetical protein